MKLFTAVILAAALLAIPAPGVSGDCSCAADAGEVTICINSDSDGMTTALKTPVTLELRGGNSKHLSAELTRITGKSITYTPSKKEDAINLDVKDAPLWDVLEALSESGKVQIARRDFMELRATRIALTTGEKVSICLERVPVRRAVDELSVLSGQPLHITAGNGETLVTLSARRITLKDILAWVSAQTGVRITEK
jgi:hypothetical protein